MVCRVGNRRFGLPVSGVREIVARPPVTRIPGVRSAARGVANVRGTLITTCSMPMLFGLGDDLPADWMVVLELRGGRIGLEVDEVEELHAAGAPGVSILRIDALLGPLFGPGGAGT